MPRIVGVDLVNRLYCRIQQKTHQRRRYYTKLLYHIFNKKDKFRVNGNWTYDYTECNRYDMNGAEYHIYTHAKSRDISTVIDVGCSDGRALKTSRLRLCKKKVMIKTVGIDIDEYDRVKKKARENLHEFRCDDVENVTEFNGQADIVICTNAFHNVSVERQYRIIKKCTDFLKPDGIIVTDCDVWNEIPHIKLVKLSEIYRKCSCCNWWARCNHAMRPESKHKTLKLGVVR